MKTIEEEAGNAYCMLVLEHGCNAGSTFGKDMFQKGAEFAQRWIPVEEENPPLDESLSESEVKYSITVEVKNGIKIQSAYFNTETGQWRSLITGFILSPTHWRPIELK